MAFFPCIYFCDNNMLYFCGTHINYSHWKFFAVCLRKGLRMILENPYSATHYLHNNFPFAPVVIDRNRRLRGDYFQKPTQYYFLNCEPTCLVTVQKDKPHKTICRLTGRQDGSGLCSEDRSMISPDYARNFICDFIIGKKQEITQPTLLDI